jgi:hypothetical protein
MVGIPEFSTETIELDDGYSRILNRNTRTL